MNQRARKCVDTLADVIEEGDDGGWRYSGTDSTRMQNHLMPILIENLSINPEGLLVSRGRVRGELNRLILAVSDDDDPVDAFEDRVDEIINGIRELKVTEYEIAFPLNFERKKSGLLPDPLEFKNIEFHSIDLSEWKSDWVPNYAEHDKNRQLYKLESFLQKSPNDIDDSQYTYWRASFRARDQHFAVNHILDALTTILGQINYAMHFQQARGIYTQRGPWPNRWAELRSPFILLVYIEDKFETHYFPDSDASLRKPDSPYSHREELFEEVLDWLPTFDAQEPLDPRLIKGFRMYQTGITNTQNHERFFAFWRGIEVMASIGDSQSLTNEDDAISGIIERVQQLFDWDNPEIARLRLDRIADKRNDYVHEGDVSIEMIDYNLAKLLLEGVINFACERREDWNVRDWNYILQQFEVDEETLDHRQSLLQRKIELLDEMKMFGGVEKS